MSRSGQGRFPGIVATDRCWTQNGCHSRFRHRAHKQQATSSSHSKTAPPNPQAWRSGPSTQQSSSARTCVVRRRVLLLLLTVHKVLTHGNCRLQQTAAPQSNDTSHDEKLARELQAQFDRGAAPVLAAPAFQVPYSCGACGTTHAVRNVAHGATFTCTVCGTENRILLHHQRPPVVVVYVERRAYSYSATVDDSRSLIPTAAETARTGCRSRSFAASSRVLEQPASSTPARCTSCTFCDP